jgi:cell division protein FtsL
VDYYGNLAYKDYSFEAAGGQTVSRPRKINRKTEYRSDAAVRKNPKRVNKKASILGIIAITALAISAGFMISKFVAVHETRNKVAELEEKLKNEEAATSQKNFELEQSVDLSKIEQEATTRLDMQRPEKYQIIYINVPTDDVTDTTAGAVEGVNHSVKGFFNRLVSNIVEFFSIK